MCLMLYSFMDSGCHWLEKTWKLYRDFSETEGRHRSDYTERRDGIPPAREIDLV